MRKKKIPRFKTIREEAAFWDTHDITDYWDSMDKVDFELVPHQKKNESLTIRLEPELKSRLNHIAKKNRVSLSTIARIWLIDRLKSEIRTKTR